MAPEQQVLQHAKLRKQLVVLERAGNAPLGRRVRRRLRDLRPVEDDRTVARVVGAGDAVEKAGLARAVWADDGKKLARLDGERNVVQRDDAAEPQRQIADLEQCRHPHHRRLRRYCFTSR